MQPPELTTGEVSKSLRDAGHFERLVKGDGYFYFAEGEAQFWPDTIVAVPRITDLSLRDWLFEHGRLKAKYVAMVGGSQH